MKQEIWVAPSILSADFARLGDDVNAVLDAGADLIHFDVMDNHYVENLTFGPMICKSLREYRITAPIDVHLMVSPVDRMIESFAKAGATYITFHPEASLHVDRSLQLIKLLGCKAGLVLNPATPISVLDYVWEYLDMILVMSVNPGFGGQKFIPSALKKLAQLRNEIDRRDLNIRLEIDGGVNEENITEISNAGADTFVAGSAVFSHQNYVNIISSLKQKAKTY